MLSYGRSMLFSEANDKYVVHTFFKFLLFLMDIALSLSKFALGCISGESVVGSPFP